MITDPNGVNLMFVSFLGVVWMDDAFEDYFKFGFLLDFINELPINFVIDTVNERFLFVLGPEIQRNSHVFEYFESDIGRKLVPVISSALSECLSVYCNGQRVKPVLFNKFDDFVSVGRIFEEIKLHDLKAIFVVFKFCDL
jgi:hypothetical protein